MGSHTLRDLAALPVETRYMRIFDAGRSGLSDVRGALREEFPVAYDAVNAERLAWAVAFNVAPPPAGASANQPAGYLGHWPASTPWAVVWSALSEPRIDRRGGQRTSLLRELACSVACERRQDWQPPGFTPSDHELADRAFEAIFARYRGQVVGEVSRRFGSRAGDQESIADEAWSRVFRDYWSSAARRRFAGLCRIPTLVSQVARYCAIDVLRQRSHDAISVENDDDGGSDAGSRLAQLSVTSDPADRMMSAETVQRIRRCVQQLPARQQVLVQMVWFREVKAVEAARLLEISEPAVSQMLKRARDGVRSCLGESEPAASGAVTGTAGRALTSASALRLLDRRSDADRR